MKRQLGIEIKVMAVTFLTGLVTWVFVIAGGAFIAARGADATYFYGLTSAFWTIAGLATILVRAIDGFSDEHTKGSPDYYRTARQIAFSGPLFVFFCLLTAGVSSADNGMIGTYDSRSVVAGMLCVGIVVASYWLADDVYRLLLRLDAWRRRRRDTANA